MSRTITLIPGDDVGPETTAVARQCVSALGIGIEWDVQEAGAHVNDREKTPLPERVLDSIRRNKVALKGPVETPIGTGFRSVNAELRRKLDLYACVRPCKYMEGIRTRISDPKSIDLVIIRENTEDLYLGIEFMANCAQENPILQFLKEQKGVELGCDTGISLKPISVKGSERIVTFAFEYAKKHTRRKVTAVDKANIMKYTDGLFMNVAYEVSTRYPDIPYEHKLVDNMCLQLVQFPEKYDVLVLPNLYGDIISDLAAGLIGGLGVAPGGNIGDEFAVFEATHGTAPDIAGQNRVDPTGILRSAVMMLDYIGEVGAARRLERAIADVVKEGKHVTADLAASARVTPCGTREMGNAITERIMAMNRE